MWLLELENKLKRINVRIDNQHKHVLDSIEQLKDLYTEREDITESLLKEENDEQNN